MDLISKQAAIEAIDSFDVLDGYQDKLELKSKIEKLPSAKAFEDVKVELYEREAQAKADKECYPDNEYLEGVFDGLHEAAKLLLSVGSRKGKWVLMSDCTGKYYACSWCGREGYSGMNFCPNCGARMEE